MQCFDHVSKKVVFNGLLMSLACVNEALRRRIAVFGRFPVMRAVASGR